MRELLVQPRFNLGFPLANGSLDGDDRVTAEIGLEGIEKSLKENEGSGHEACTSGLMTSSIRIKLLNFESWNRKP